MEFQRTQVYLDVSRGNENVRFFYIYNEFSLHNEFIILKDSQGFCLDWLGNLTTEEFSDAYQHGTYLNGFSFEKGLTHSCEFVRDIIKFLLQHISFKLNHTHNRYRFEL